MPSGSEAAVDQHLAMAKSCGRKAAIAGFKAAAVAAVASAVPTLASVRMLPWARANINPTGQALIISTVAGMAYFIVSDKTVIALARKNALHNAKAPAAAQTPYSFRPEPFVTTKNGAMFWSA